MNMETITATKTKIEIIEIPLDEDTFDTQIDVLSAILP